jgi:type I restriction enzyme S subunit
MAMNKSCYGIRGKKGIPDIFFYYTILQQVAYLNRSGHDSVFNTSKSDTFKTTQVPSPLAGLTSTLEEQVASLFNKTPSHLFKSKTLSELRDYLLPKLLSGEFAIHDAGKLLEEQS